MQSATKNRGGWLSLNSIACADRGGVPGSVSESLPRLVEIQVRDPVDGFGTVVSRAAKTRPVTFDGAAETVADRYANRPASPSAGVFPRLFPG